MALVHCLSSKKIQPEDERRMMITENKHSQRRAKWWYSTFHTVTVIVGAGVLSLPFAMAYLGWGPGILTLLVSWGLTLNSMWQMIEMHECVPGTRFDRFHDLGRYAFGPKLGAWIVLPLQLIVQVGSDIVYMVIGGKCLYKFMEIACTNCTQPKVSYAILSFGAIHFFLSQLPNFDSVVGVSLLAALMSVSYSTIAWVACLSKGQSSDVSYGYMKFSRTELIWRMFNALGQISFAFAGHAVTLEIQARIPSTPEKPSKIAMWKGVIVAYLINAICYFPVAITGYWAFGRYVSDNVVDSLENPEWLIASANLMVFIHMVGGYQVFAMPVFDLIEKVINKKLKISEGLILRLVVRSAYVAFTLFIGKTFPFFGDLLGFFGGLSIGPTSYFLPSIIWLIIKKPKRFSINWFINWGSILIGVCIMLASIVAGVRNLYVDAHDYYQFR
ncbi:hypothetical protein PIB30_039770 [Stylosanthes scabra]|uniref:Amino acid transporter transmembrane domain-containing protein n=2 Tax=Stylosanthes scabra TaxID=79078 RepID=A0ABU6UD27_9FABA|nr:hypothetical protein [Stylosanthes scabra]